MSVDFTRRELLATLAALGLVGPAFADNNKLIFGKPAAFSFDGLVDQARALAKKPYADVTIRASDTLEAIDYDAHWKIKFKPEYSLDSGAGKAPVRFFHLGRFFKKPVGIYLVDGDKAREVLYSPKYFDMPDDSPAKRLPDDIGFAGFRVMDESGERDWLAFLGAAYFRSSGELDQYGLSARAVAVDTAMPTPEEFPRFTDFWFAPSATGSLIIYCLMNSPRITGALRMDIDRSKGVVMTISARYFARAAMDRVGLAPLTSMFWYSETNHRQGLDWRPEIHDSDGLAIWTGAGERLWRPLNNPPRVMTSSFVDFNPMGFALAQRDRNFENYQDDGVFYDKRSTVWVEPIGEWGAGSVQLVEIPTDDEIHDNIVAYWVRRQPVKAGDSIAIDYKLHWLKDEPYPPQVARVYSTRIGMGGVPGQARPQGVAKVVVDFDGGGIEQFGQQDGVEAVVTSSSGEISGVYQLPVVGTTRWRAVFDFTAESLDPVEMRLFLRRDGTALSETWLYQFHPTSAKAKG